MSAIQLLEAIGNIDDKLIAEAASVKKAAVHPIHWIKYGSIAACFLLVFTLIYGLSTIRMGSKDASAEADTAGNLESITEDVTDADTDSDFEYDSKTDANPESEADTETDIYEESDGDMESSPQSGSSENNYDPGYSIVVNGKTYLPISFEQRKEFHLVPADATVLTPDNTYQITDEDLNEIIGTVTFSPMEQYIGLTLYHFDNYAETDTIGILDNHGTYEFYVIKNAE